MRRSRAVTRSIVRTPEDELRALDDRSLNGLFVNGEQVEWAPLSDGDELEIGRYRLYVSRRQPAVAGGAVGARELIAPASRDAGRPRYSVEMFGSAWTRCGTIIRKLSCAALARARRCARPPRPGR